MTRCGSHCAFAFVVLTCWMESDLCDELGLQPTVFGYITPKDMLAGHQQEIQADRDRKLEAAREQRKNRSQRAA
jgi:hypothetical protein